MSSAFFVRTPDNCDGEDESDPGDLYHDPIEALIVFLRAVQDHEWADLRWSS